MTIELAVLPQTHVAAPWREVRERFRQLAGPLADTVVGPDPNLVAILTGQRLDPAEPLKLETAYRLELLVANTLTVARWPNQGYATPDEPTWVEDWGRAHTPKRIAEIASRWRQVGFFYDLKSMGGRGPDEPELFTTLALALAHTCDGLIVTMHGTAWSRGVGVHTPDEFTAVETRF